LKKYYVIITINVQETGTVSSVFKSRFYVFPEKKGFYRAQYLQERTSFSAHFRGFYPGHSGSPCYDVCWNQVGSL